MLKAIEIYGLKSTSLLNESFANYLQKMKEFKEDGWTKDFVIRGFGSNPVGSIVFLYSGRRPKFVKMILDLERTVYGVGTKLFGIRFL